MVYGFMDFNKNYSRFWSIRKRKKQLQQQRNKNQKNVVGTSFMWDFIALYSYVYLKIIWCENVITWYFLSNVHLNVCMYKWNTVEL